MMDLILLLAYLVGLLPAWRVAYVQLAEHDKRKHPYMDTERGLHALMGGICAVFWPVILAGYLPYRWVTRPLPSERREAKEAQQRRELEHLRKLAREHGLLMLEDQ